VGAALPTSASTTSWTTVALDPAAKGASIPADFLGISHEWTNVEELNHGGSYLQLLKDLSAYGSGSLVVRVGGGSTDMQRSLPPASTWGQLRQLHKATGVQCGARARACGPVCGRLLCAGCGVPCSRAARAGPRVADQHPHPHTRTHTHTQQASATSLGSTSRTKT
jgi:hypothetical protein